MIKLKKIRKYKKDLPYSYTLGIFLTIELLKLKPKRIQSVILHTKGKNSQGISKIIKLCDKENINYVYNDKLINILSPKGNCYAIGVFNKYEKELTKDNNHIVLVNPSDSGNLGTIIRTALGFGIKNLAIIKPAVDIFDPKTIRSSMGALFNIGFNYYNSFNEYVNSYEEHYFYPFMLNAKENITSIKPKEPFSLIFGNEGCGLDDSFHNVGTSVIIPHNKDIDSLNLSIAVAIAIYEFTKSHI